MQEAASTMQDAEEEGEQAESSAVNTTGAGVSGIAADEEDETVQSGAVSTAGRDYNDVETDVEQSSVTQQPQKAKKPVKVSSVSCCSVPT